MAPPKAMSAKDRITQIDAFRQLVLTGNGGSVRLQESRAVIMLREYQLSPNRSFEVDSALKSLFEFLGMESWWTAVDIDHWAPLWFIRQRHLMAAEVQKQKQKEKKEREEKEKEKEKEEEKEKEKEKEKKKEKKAKGKIGPTPFMEWPPEIRNGVYETVFERNFPIPLHRRLPPPGFPTPIIDYAAAQCDYRSTGTQTYYGLDPVILRVSKTIYGEAIRFLYSKNTFSLRTCSPDHNPQVLRSLGLGVRSLIQEVEIAVAVPSDVQKLGCIVRHSGLRFCMQLKALIIQVVNTGGHLPTSISNTVQILCTAIHCTVDHGRPQLTLLLTVSDRINGDSARELTRFFRERDYQRRNTRNFSCNGNMCWLPKETVVIIDGVVTEELLLQILAWRDGDWRFVREEEIVQALAVTRYEKRLTQQGASRSYKLVLVKTTPTEPSSTDAGAEGHQS